MLCVTVTLQHQQLATRFRCRVVAVDAVVSQMRCDVIRLDGEAASDVAQCLDVVVCG